MAGFGAHILRVATDGRPAETSITGLMGLEQIADPPPKCSNCGPGRDQERSANDA